MDDNVFQLGQIKGGKPEADQLPNNEYLIVDKNQDEHYHKGFLLFTSQHVAIMQDRNDHTIPVFMMPLAELAFLEVVDDEEIIDN